MYGQFFFTFLYSTHYSLVNCLPPSCSGGQPSGSFPSQNSPLEGQQWPEKGHSGLTEAWGPLGLLECLDHNILSSDVLCLTDYLL